MNLAALAALYVGATHAWLAPQTRARAPSALNGVKVDTDNALSAAEWDRQVALASLVPCTGRHQQADAAKMIRHGVSL